MASFRKDILQQIERIDAGHIFTFQDLSFDTDKMANVAVLLSGQSRKGLLVRIEKGAYYRLRKFPVSTPSLSSFLQITAKFIEGTL